MTNTKEQVKIETYNDFIKQLSKISESSTDLLLSYYKYCWRYNNNHYKYCRKCMIELLQPYGLKPIKVTKHLNLILRFNNIAEAIVYVKHCGIDLCIYKH